MINLLAFFSLRFAEKIFIFSWLWFFCLFFVALLNLLFWAYRTLSMPSKVRMVNDALRLHNRRPPRPKVRLFIQDFLKLDGVVVLRLIDSNAGYIHMAEVVHQLWLSYSEEDVVALMPANEQLSINS